MSAEVLGSLADALRLDDVERAHLFALAGLRPSSVSVPSMGPSGVTPALRALLDGLDPNPAYLLDRAWNIVAWNEAEAALFADLAVEPAPNLLRLVFGSPVLASLMADHDAEMVRLVAQFRVHWTDWGDDPSVEALVEELCETSAAFASLWAAEDVAPFVTTRRVFDHPVRGRLEYDHHRFAALDQPGMQLVVYTPAPA